MQRQLAGLERELVNVEKVLERLHQVALREAAGVELPEFLVLLDSMVLQELELAQGTRVARRQVAVGRRGGSEENAHIRMLYREAPNSGMGWRRVLGSGPATAHPQSVGRSYSTRHLLVKAKMARPGGCAIGLEAT